MGPYIVDLYSRRALQESCTGGKGAGLAWLHRKGFRIPPGFAVAPLASRRFFDSFDFAPFGRPESWTEASLDEIRARLLAHPSPGHLQRTIARAYRRLGGPVAVRSSMVGEDAATTSFAGQLKTTLDVEGKQAVEEAVRQCWTSVFGWHFYAYLNEHQGTPNVIALESLPVAVVVQRMVAARAAGIAFSADPITGEVCVIIEATLGLGDALAQGLAEPERYTVDARGSISQIKGLSLARLALDDNQVLRLAKIVRAVANCRGTPQNIEWALEGDTFYLLQCRPISCLVGKNVYSSKLSADMAPGLIKPLVWSTKTTGMARNVFGRVFSELIGPSDTDYSALSKRIRSRLYTNTTLLGDLFERLGLPRNYAQMMARDELAEWHRPPMNLETARAVQRLLRFSWQHGRIASEVETFLKTHNRNLDGYRSANWAATNPQLLLEQADLLLHMHSQTQWYVMLAPMNAMVRSRILRNLVRRLVPDIDPGELIGDLIGHGAPGPNDRLQELGMEAKLLSDDVLSVLNERDVQKIHADLASSEQGQALLHKVDTFLQRYGFLSTNGSDFTDTPWIENPSFVWHAIHRTAAVTTQRAADDACTRREIAQQHVLSHLNPIQGFLFSRLLQSVQTYADLRERTSLLMSEDSYQMRRIFLALGEHLVASGQLEHREDVFYLMYDELKQLVLRGLSEQTAQELVAARRAEMAADANAELPETICGEYLTTAPPQTGEGQRYLVGIGGSSGIVQGYARVVHNLDESPIDLERSDILVVPFTDASWTPLFVGLGGIVAETGGQLSHTSIIAREYGLPAVVSVRHATRLIRDGQALTLDGRRGRVYLDHVLHA